MLGSLGGLPNGISKSRRNGLHTVVISLRCPGYLFQWLLEPQAVKDVSDLQRSDEGRHTLVELAWQAKRLDG